MPPRPSALLQSVSLVFAISFAATAVSAQTTIASDRPGIGSGSVVVAPGVLQLETGISYSSSTAGHAYSVGQALVRFGVSKVELELFANSFVSARSELSPGLDENGLQDTGVGIKLPVTRGLGGRADVSLQGILTIPTGSDGFTADEWVPAVNALADIALGDRAALSANVGYQAGPGALSDVFTVIVTPALSLGDGFGVYGGWAGAFSDGGDSNFAEGGLTYLASPDLQLDLNGGWSLDDDDWFFGAGVAVRRSPR